MLLFYQSFLVAVMLEFITTSFIRGNTLDDCIVIFDEAQNTTDHECNSVITRLGENAKIIVCGDSKQCDLEARKFEVTGFLKLLAITRSMQKFSQIEFDTSDIVRSGLVKEYLISRELYESNFVNEYNTPKLPRVFAQSVSA
jgi:phosphate starvation-inducible protein PhoH